MLPVACGPQRTVFGAYHEAVPTAGCSSRAVGVVLCCPIGWEAIASQRSLRLLAERLAHQGFHVLRFDYQGTGDSAGSEHDPNQVAAWLRSIHVAIDELRRLSGVEQVSLVGLHLGATLAFLAASERGAEVASLTLWAPYLTGRTYLRQVRAYRLLNNPDAPALEDGSEDAAGYLLTGSTVAELNKVDLLAVPPPACRAALILARDVDAASAEDKLSKALQAKGIPNDVARIAGYLPMMQEPRKSEPPLEVFAAIEAWLDKTHPEQAAPQARAERTSSNVLQLPGARERAFFFGPENQLFGIVTEPEAPVDRRRPVLVWLNTASDHRVGPNRLYVTLARTLAQRGFVSLRFDPRGVGDGGPTELTPQVAHAYSATRLEDARAALAWLATNEGAESFTLVGLCSAAYLAFHVALQDPRVVNEVLVNPQTFVWRDGDSLELSVNRSVAGNRFYWHHIRKVETWRRIVKGEVALARVGKIVASRLLTRALRPVRRWLPQTAAGGGLDVEQAFRTKLERGVATLVVFSENDGGLDYVEGELGSNGSALRAAGRFSFELLSKADHTFSQAWMKDWLSSRIIRHFEDSAQQGGQPRGAIAHLGRQVTPS